MRRHQCTLASWTMSPWRTAVVAVAACCAPAILQSSTRHGASSATGCLRHSLTPSRLPVPQRPPWWWLRCRPRSRSTGAAVRPPPSPTAANQAVATAERLPNRVWRLTLPGGSPAESAGSFRAAVHTCQDGRDSGMVAGIARACSVTTRTERSPIGDNLLSAGRRYARRCHLLKDAAVETAGSPQVLYGGHVLGVRQGAGRC